MMPRRPDTLTVLFSVNIAAAIVVVAAFPIMTKEGTHGWTTGTPPPLTGSGNVILAGPGGSFPTSNGPGTDSPGPRIRVSPASSLLAPSGTPSHYSSSRAGMDRTFSAPSNASAPRTATIPIRVVPSAPVARPQTHDGTPPPVNPPTRTGWPVWTPTSPPTDSGQRPPPL